MSSPATIRFGTDGWRARIADEYTFANVRICAQGLADWIHKSGQAARGVVVGYDTRFLSDQFAEEAAQVLAGNGIAVKLADRPAPTPACSLAVKNAGAAAGVMITASHNPAQDNGFKIKAPIGSSAPPEMVSAIEAEVQAVQARGGSVANGRRAVIRRFNPISPYVDQLRTLVDIEKLRSAGLNIVTDPMYGAGAGILLKLLKSRRNQVTEVNGEYNPAFPGMTQPEPVDHNLTGLKRTVNTLRADVGIATDGDADRVGIVSEEGVYFSTLQVFSLLTQHMWARRQEGGGVACTITQSSMLDRLAGHYGRKVYRTQVGFKYVGPTMLENGCALGGEESGGYAFKGHIPERDGCLSGLLFLEAMVETGLKPSGLLSAMHEITGPHSFRRIDLKFASAKRDAVASRLKATTPSRLGHVRVVGIDRRDGARFDLEGGSWAVARLSGTEPLVRLYAEAPDEVTRDSVLSSVREELGV